MFSLNKKNNKRFTVGEPIAIDWAKTEEDKYYNLLSLKPEEYNLAGFGGVYMIWFSGLKTTVIYTGVTDDFVGTFNLAKDNMQILSYHEKGPIGITWAPIQEKYRNRIATYLKMIMPPLLPSVPEIDGSFAEEDPFAVIPPFYV